MIDEHDVREMLHRRASAVDSSELDAPRAARRARRRLLANGAVAVLAMAAIALATFAGVSAVRTAPVPADDGSKELGIFAPVAGRILFSNEDPVGVAGYDGGLWAIDPSGPTDTTAGPRVADDVISTLVPLAPPDAIPLGWSSDGTELLFERMHGDLIVQEDLYVLHADGSETLLVRGYGGSAAIAPDGTRVVFAGACGRPGLCVIDAEGGRPAPLPFPADKDAYSPTFSPGGTRIAYLVDQDDHLTHVWVADVDGSSAPRDILAPEETRSIGAGSLRWSPAGDRLAIGMNGSEGNGDVSAIYTFAPDGSDFTRVIVYGDAPSWSPDGSRIAYTINCTEASPDPSCADAGAVLQLAIADADGSNERAFGFGTSGPWHPGPSVRPDEFTTEPSESFTRANGEVLSFGGVVSLAGQPYDRTGDLGAVNPETGEERLLVADLDKVRFAEWSADGGWVAYERHDGNDIELWVVGGSQDPRLIATGGYLFADGSVGWAWSSTGADLLLGRRMGSSNTIERSKLTLVDVEADETSDLGTIDGDIGLDPAWSPDGTRIALATGNGAVYSVDLGTGERSLLMRLPDTDLDPSPSIQWSPDGTRVSVVNDLGDAGERLYVVDADGSDVQQLTESGDLLLVSWSPDGSRLAFASGSAAEGETRIFVAPIDGSDPAEIGSVPFVGCSYNYMCGLTWSPDGISIGFHRDDAGDSAIPADGSRDPEPIDDLTYMSWAGGRYGEA
jgi:Tol biopolymer transport system component